MSSNVFAGDAAQTITVPRRRKAIFFSLGDFEQIILNFNVNKAVSFSSLDLKYGIQL